MNNHSTQSSFMRVIKKFFLSAFVVVSFIGYALHNRSAYATGNLSQNEPAPGGGSPAQTTNSNSSANQAPSAASTTPTQQAAPVQQQQAEQPTQPPAPTDTAPAPAPSTAQNGQYKDGTYTGPEVDVNWGLVQVQAVIQNGRISNVKFLEYPSDRRTSQRINSFAVPTLQQEAVQAQSANVNMLTGATLTSEGFQMSLQDALNQAKAQ